MAKKNISKNDSFDKRDDDEMEDDIEEESSTPKDFNPDVLEEALADDDGSDPEEGLEHESLDKEIEEETEEVDFINGEEENPFWKL